MIDLVAEHDSTLDIGAITRLQRMKTGDIIAFSSVAGAILGQAPHPARVALPAYAHDLGLAFQIVDDLLDVEATAAIGKQIGDDAAGARRPSSPSSGSTAPSNACAICWHAPT